MRQEEEEARGWHFAAVKSKDRGHQHLNGGELPKRGVKEPQPHICDANLD